ncbi:MULTISPECIES: hypothetical protein [Stutzerimonas]|uniref:hypothetical protein n=1 Tax=Stutzerimonas TaxID=2901164 RepID=UPI002108C9E3|nr:hypothetical protein [Stutzerimonas stutzeri]MCQ4258716.1 hypothetical protein [Stutzerimonas stutzeri]
MIHIVQIRIWISNDQGASKLLRQLRWRQLLASFSDGGAFTQINIEFSFVPQSKLTDGQGCRLGLLFHTAMAEACPDPIFSW